MDEDISLALKLTLWVQQSGHTKLLGHTKRLL